MNFMRLANTVKKITNVNFFIYLLFIFVLFVSIVFGIEYKYLKKELQNKDEEIYRLHKIDSLRQAYKIEEAEDFLIIEFIDSVKNEISNNNEKFEQKIDSIRNIPDSVKLRLWYARYR